MSSLRQNPKAFICVLFSIRISGDSTSYLIKLIMLINLECILAQTRMELDEVTLCNMGPIRGHYVFVILFIGL